MTRETIDGVEVITHLGWFWNPFEKRWEHDQTPMAAMRPGARHTILIASGYDLEHPPRFSPWQLAG